MQNETYLSISQAAKRLAVSHWTLRTWVKEGKLNAFKLGNRLIRIPESEVEKLLRPRSEVER